MSKSTPLDLINLLADAEFHSGEAIGELLGVSRAAVWKKLQGLQELGLEVESVKGRGYRLVEPRSLFDEQRLKQFAEQSDAAISIFDSIDSTNAEMLRSLADAKAKAGDVVLAELQTGGRGRRGKAWASPFAANLYCSVLASFEDGAGSLDGLSLVVGISLVEALEQQGIENAKLKWPNDVLVDNKKLAGILLEVSGDPTGLCHVVIGVGVNINMHNALGKIDQPWLSMAKILQKPIDKNTVLINLLQALDKNIALFKVQGFAAFLEKWQQLDAFADAEVCVSLGDAAVFGIYQWVKAKGEMRVYVDGNERVFNGGEVSLRKQ
jgi:BirA family biotin operon repressor/biotin-[acetyl-CoA-carboxylase] ligase